MAISPDSLLRVAALVLAGAALGYLGAALGLLWAWRPATRVTSVRAPVSVLKPLCGAEPELYENLRSFCDQDYPAFEVVFGVRDATDPALRVARRLAAEFPERSVHIVVDPRVAGPNHKASNLANMVAAARHDWLVVADSDIRVGRDYLSRLMGPLMDPGVGLVTCLYRARAAGTLWGALGSQLVNEWFLPSVLVARALGSSAYVSGATIALRRAVLDAIGGFAALTPHLADDYELGRRTRARGLRTVVSDVLVETLVAEASGRALVRHELRWLRTIRGVTPWGYAGAGVTFTLAICLLAAPLVGAGAWALALPAVALALRLLLHFTAQRRLAVPGAALKTAPLVPLRELLGFAEWVVGFFIRRVRWRQLDLAVQPGGRVRTVMESSR
ncbi:MAG TPA: bacteriohopanetetrol glucosamine biosynthesis glycosyltransferase HpnI [Gemmatimonadales bacterium]|nr:bacteriohopanetetrol glucosamine biosynthesis glycosyltransferase HpnI [Gemmatimonadales bacterium]